MDGDSKTLEGVVGGCGVIVERKKEDNQRLQEWWTGICNPAGKFWVGFFERVSLPASSAGHKSFFLIQLKWVVCACAAPVIKTGPLPLPHLIARVQVLGLWLAHELGILALSTSVFCYSGSPRPTSSLPRCSSNEVKVICCYRVFAVPNFLLI